MGVEGERQGDFPVAENPQQADELINQYLLSGWNIERHDPLKSEGIRFGIIAPSGSYFRLDGIFLDDGSEIDYEFMTEERQSEWDQASHILDLMFATPKYLAVEI